MPSAPANLPEGEEEGHFYTSSKYDFYIHWLKNGDNYIYGRINVPKDYDKEKEYPTVIMSHGFTGTFRNFETYVVGLTALGFVCYTFDFCGGANASKSDGNFLDMTVFTEVSDLKAVVADIRRQTYFKPGPITLMGESQGGLVTALAALELSGISALALLYPGFSIPEDLNKKYASVDEVPAENELLGVKVGREYITSLIGLDIYGELSKYKGRTIIFHGENDKIVPLFSSVKAAQSYADCKLVTVRNEWHGFSPGAAYDVCDAFVEWYNEGKA